VTHFRSKDTHRLKVKGWKKIFPENANKKKAGVAILVSEGKKKKNRLQNTDYNKDKVGYYMMIKR